MALAGERRRFDYRRIADWSEPRARKSPTSGGVGSIGRRTCRFVTVEVSRLKLERVPLHHCATIEVWSLDFAKR